MSEYGITFHISTPRKRLLLRAGARKAVVATFSAGMAAQLSWHQCEAAV